MTEKDTAVMPKTDGGDPFYQATRKALENVSEPKKSLADLGLAKVTFTYLENGTLHTSTVTVQAQTVTAVLNLLEDGEIG